MFKKLVPVLSIWLTLMPVAAFAAPVTTPIIAKEQAGLFSITRPSRSMTEPKLMKVLACGQRTFAQWQGKKDANFFRVLIEERDSFGRLTGRIWEDESRNKYQPISLDGCVNESVAYIASSGCDLTGCSQTLGTTRKTPWLNDTNKIGGGHTGGAPFYYNPTDIPRSFGGIRQVRGVLSLVSLRNAEDTEDVKSIYGSSAVKMINANGDVVTVNPPWFKNILDEQVRIGWILWYFARLPNGFEVIEIRSDNPNLQKRFVINDGKNWIEEGSRIVDFGAYSAGYDKVTYTLDRDLEPTLIQDNNGVAFIYDPSATTYFLENRSLKRFLLHGIPNNSLTLVGYDVKRIGGHFEIRYALKDSTGRITVWKAWVQ